MNPHEITAEWLRTQISYDPETGRMWRIAGRFTNSEGTAHCEGYIQFSIGYPAKLFLAHRLAWLYVTGSWPEGELDHENGIRNDNRWKNLRPATRQDQRRNSCVRSDSLSGIKGVSWNKAAQKWSARIMVGYRSQFLGYFLQKEDAVTARREASKIYFGEFARANEP